MYVLNAKHWLDHYDVSDIIHLYVVILFLKLFLGKLWF